MKEYETINHMYKDLDIDKEHWINKEAILFNKKQTFEQSEVTLQHIPEDLLAIKGICKNRHIFNIDWLKKTYPYIIYYDSRNKRILRQHEISIKCPRCNSDTRIKIPLKKYLGDIDIYGDESFRVINNKTAIIYGFLSIFSETQQSNEFIQQYNELKKLLIPDSEPNSWILHMKDLTNSKKRNKSKIFNTLDKKDIDDFCVNLCSLINEYNENGTINIYASIGISEEINMKEDRSNIYKGLVYTSSIVKIIREITSNGLSPKFYFERTNKDGWAKRLFKGYRLCNIWPFITCGLPVKSTVFIPPTSNKFLEIADFINFTIARELHVFGKSFEEQSLPSNDNLKHIGLIRYSLIDGKGNFNQVNSIGFPYKDMFKNTEWDK